MMNKNFKELLNERLKDKEFKKEYDKLTPEYEEMKSNLRKSKEKNK